MNVARLLNNVTAILTDSEDEHDEEPSAKSVANFAKFVTMLALFVVSMSSGMVPRFLAKCFNWTDPNKDPRTNLVVSSLLSFGGGALLATTFMHLLPEIDETILRLQAEGRLSKWEFSITNLLMGIGFFIIYLVEEIVHAYLRGHQKRQREAQEAFIRGHSPRESLRDASTRRELEKKMNNNGNISFSTADLVSADSESVDNSHQAHHSHNHHHHSHIPTIDGDDLIVSSIRGLLIVLALSVHEIFEGLAVGLEPTTSNVWYMFVSISAHKVVIAFCIGVELIVHKTKPWLVTIYIFVYAIVSPVGIAIGVWVSNADGSEAFEIASVVLQGLAAGTLLYVIFFEILSKNKDGIVQYFAVVLGFFLLFGLKFLGKREKEIFAVQV